MFDAPVIIDCRGHLLGRLASIVAKELLCGQRVVLVRCEEMNISGSFIRNKLLFMSYLRKKMNTNPAKGPYHFRAPSRMVWRTIRSMMQHKISRCEAALERLKVSKEPPPPTLVRARTGQSRGSLLVEVGQDKPTVQREESGMQRGSLSVEQQEVSHRDFRLEKRGWTSAGRGRGGRGRAFSRQLACQARESGGLEVAYSSQRPVLDDGGGS